MKVHKIDLTGQAPTIKSSTPSKSAKKQADSTCSIAAHKQHGQDHRPVMFDSFIGQDINKKVLKTAIASAKANQHTLGHILFIGPSGYGKTTLSHIISNELGGKCYTMTAYAINKPADIISILQKCEHNDILFIDEIHRLKPNIEEILYIAMEDQRIDLILPDGSNMEIPIKPFTLIGATTQGEKLSKPLKNRFVYSCHLEEYTQQQKELIIVHHLKNLDIDITQNMSIKIAKKIHAVPREIKNFCIKIRDWLIIDEQEKSIKNQTTNRKQKMTLSEQQRESFVERSNTSDHGLNHIHQKYLETLRHSDSALGLKTIAIKLNLSEQHIEEDIEPLLIQLGYIEKTTRGRRHTGKA